MSTSLIKILSTEATFIKLIGLLPFKLTTNQKRFTDSQQLFYLQLLVIIPLSIACLWFQTDYSVLPHSTDFQSESAASLASFLYNALVVADAYFSVLLFANRLYSRKEFIGIYNSLLDIDNEIHHLSPKGFDVNWLRNVYLQRIIFLCVIFVTEAYEDILDIVQVKPFVALSFLLFRIMIEILFCQMLNVLQTLRRQANTIILNIKEADTNDQVKRNYQTFMKMFNLIAQVNSIYALQIFVNTFTGLYFVLFYLYDITTSVQNIGIGVLFSSKARKWLISISLSVSFGFLLIYELTKLKENIRNVITELQKAEKRLQINSNPYYILCLWLDERLDIVFQNYWLSIDRRTIFKVKFTSVSRHIKD